MTSSLDTATKERSTADVGVVPARVKAAAGQAQAPSWSALVVVCKDCQKRGSGPKRLKAKDVIREARSVCKAERPRPRIVASGCLGLCPKRAIAVARIGPEGARIVGAAAAQDVTRLLPALPPA